MLVNKFKFLKMIEEVFSREVVKFGFFVFFVVFRFFVLKLFMFEIIVRFVVLFRLEKLFFFYF